MKRGIYRQAALDRLSSPEQLDQIFHVIDSKHWVALAAILLLVISAMSWGYLGSVVVTSSGPGMIVNRAGIASIVSQSSGLVLSVRVKAGDELTPHQMIATLAPQPEMIERLNTNQNALSEELAKREATLRSQRNSSLLELKILDRQRADAERKLARLEQQETSLKEQITGPNQLPANNTVKEDKDPAAQLKLSRIQNGILNLQALIKQLDARSFTIQSQSDELDKESRLRISGLQREIASIEKELRSAETIVTPDGGTIVSVNVVPGARIDAGEPIASFQPDSEKLEVLAYVPFAEAKHIRKGMPVRISFAGTEREDAGSLQGGVLSVSDFPSSSDTLLRQLPVEFVKRYITDPASFAEIRVVLPTDAASQGLSTSAINNSAVITRGKACTVKIVTRQQRPVALVLPYFREKFGLN